MSGHTVTFNRRVLEAGTGEFLASRDNHAQGIYRAGPGYHPETGKKKVVLQKDAQAMYPVVDDMRLVLANETLFPKNQLAHDLVEYSKVGRINPHTSELTRSTSQDAADSKAAGLPRLFQGKSKASPPLAETEVQNSGLPLPIQNQEVSTSLNGAKVTRSGKIVDGNGTIVAMRIPGGEFRWAEHGSGSSGAEADLITPSSRRYYLIIEKNGGHYHCRGDGSGELLNTKTPDGHFVLRDGTLVNRDGEAIGNLLDAFAPAAGHGKEAARPAVKLTSATTADGARISLRPRQQGARDTFKIEMDGKVVAKSLSSDEFQTLDEKGGLTGRCFPVVHIGDRSFQFRVDGTLTPLLRFGSDLFQTREGTLINHQGNLLAYADHEKNIFVHPAGLEHLEVVREDGAWHMLRPDGTREDAICKTVSQMLVFSRGVFEPRTKSTMGTVNDKGEYMSPSGRLSAPILQDGRVFNPLRPDQQELRVDQAATEKRRQAGDAGVYVLSDGRLVDSLGWVQTDQAGKPLKNDEHPYQPPSAAVWRMEGAGPSRKLYTDGEELVQTSKARKGMSVFGEKKRVKDKDGKESEEIVHKYLVSEDDNLVATWSADGMFRDKYNLAYYAIAPDKTVIGQPEIKVDPMSMYLLDDESRRKGHCLLTNGVQINAMGREVRKTEPPSPRTSADQDR